MKQTGVRGNTKIKSPLLTLQEAADYLRMHEMTLYRYAKAGKIPCFKIGGRWRIKQVELDGMIQNDWRAT